MNDPLDAVFVTGDEAAELKRTDTARKLATYLERMPTELRGMFVEQFQRISSAELAQLRAESQRRLEDLEMVEKNWLQLRADLQAAQARINALESGDLVAALIADNQNQADRILEQARQLEEARTILQFIGKHDYPNGTLRNAASNWLAANPAPQEPQP